MEFRKYPSIENSYRKKFIEAIRELSIAEWVVQEKAHGANVVIAYDGHEILYGKRSGWLDDGEKFYNLRIAVPASAIVGIMRMKNVRIYGEIIGGSFPGMKVDGAIRVQKGVYYTPSNEFYAFDAMVDDEFLTVDEAEALFKELGLVYAKTLFRGTLDECLAFPVEFDSTIPELYGLPQLENNLCEGIVIKPVAPEFLPWGSRVIIKKKNQRFAEKTRTKKERKVVNVPDDALALITENRLRNAISRVGPIGDKDFGKLLGEFTKDVVEEYEKDHDPLDKQTKRQLSKECADMIRRNFVNIIDGAF